MSTLTLPEISGAEEAPPESVMRHSHIDAVQSPVKKGGAEQSSAGKKRMEQAKAGIAVAELEAALAGISSASKTAAGLAELQDMSDNMNRKLEKEEERSSTLDDEVKKMHDTLIAAKKNRGGVYGVKTGTDAIQKQVKNLEKRLDKARSNYNLAIDANNTLKVDIQTVRAEIQSGQHMLNAELKILSEKREQLADITDQCQQAYVSRDQAKMAMDRLKTEAKVAEETFVQQWDRLKYVMEEDRKLTHETKRLCAPPTPFLSFPLPLLAVLFFALPSPFSNAGVVAVLSAGS